MLGNNTTRIAICEKKERDDVVVVRFFLYVDKKRGGKVRLLYRISKKVKS